MVLNSKGYRPRGVCKTFTSYPLIKNCEKQYKNPKLSSFPNKNFSVTYLIKIKNMLHIICASLMKFAFCIIIAHWIKTHLTDEPEIIGHGGVLVAVTVNRKFCFIQPVAFALLNVIFIIKFRIPWHHHVVSSISRQPEERLTKPVAWVSFSKTRESPSTIQIGGTSPPIQSTIARNLLDFRTYSFITEKQQKLIYTVQVLNITECIRLKTK